MSVTDFLDELQNTIPCRVTGTNKQVETLCASHTSSIWKLSLGLHFPSADGTGSEQIFVVPRSLPVPAKYGDEAEQDPLWTFAL